MRSRSCLVEAEVFVQDFSLAARDSAGPWESCSQGLAQGQLMEAERVSFPDVEESRDERSSVLAPPGNIVLGEKVSCINCASLRKLPSQGASIILCVSTAPHQLTSQGELPWGAATSVSDPV